MAFCVTHQSELLGSAPAVNFSGKRTWASSSSWATCRCPNSIAWCCSETYISLSTAVQCSPTEHIVSIRSHAAQILFHAGAAGCAQVVCALWWHCACPFWGGDRLLGPQGLNPVRLNPMHLNCNSSVKPSKDTGHGHQQTAQHSFTHQGRDSIIISDVRWATRCQHSSTWKEQHIFGGF